jgi:hypothetical protein
MNHWACAVHFDDITDLLLLKYFDKEFADLILTKAIYWLYKSILHWEDISKKN